MVLSRFMPPALGATYTVILLLIGSPLKRDPSGPYHLRILQNPNRTQLKTKHIKMGMLLKHKTSHTHVHEKPHTQHC